MISRTVDRSKTNIADFDIVPGDGLTDLGWRQSHWVIHNYELMTGDISDGSHKASNILSLFNSPGIATASIAQIEVSPLHNNTKHLFLQ